MYHWALIKVCVYDIIKTTRNIKTTQTRVPKANFVHVTTQHTKFKTFSLSVVIVIGSSMTAMSNMYWRKKWWRCWCNYIWCWNKLQCVSGTGKVYSPNCDSDIFAAQFRKSYEISKKGWATLQTKNIWENVMSR